MTTRTDRPAAEVSLVVGTVDRAEELGRFLDSLRGQSTDRFELVVVDQNEDDRVARVLAERGDGLAVVHVRVPWRGLSRARNHGVQHASARLLAFPDDDCSYPPGLVADVLHWFAANPRAAALSCRVADERGRRSAGGFMARRSHWVARSNVWRSAVGPGLFVRRSFHDSVEGFDAELGAGAGTPWGSGEDTDYVLRGLAEGLATYYAADTVVHHPKTIHRGPRFSRWWGYGQGMGFVLRRHRYRLPAATYFAGVSWGAAILSLLRLDFGPAVARAVMGTGRLVGWQRSARALRAEAPSRRSPAFGASSP